MIVATYTITAHMTRHMSAGSSMSPQATMLPHGVLVACHSPPLQFKCAMQGHVAKGDKSRTVFWKLATPMKISRPPATATPRLPLKSLSCASGSSHPSGEITARKVPLSMHAPAGTLSYISLPALPASRQNTHSPKESKPIHMPIQSCADEIICLPYFSGAPFSWLMQNLH